MKEVLCGIYMWEVILPGKWFGGKYIGQSIDIYTRKRGHELDLYNQDHHNKKFQRFYNKYGIESFKFTILLTCSEKELDFWEKWYIKSFNTYKTKINFNMTPGGDCSNLYLTTQKPGVLFNIKTKKLESFDSIASFARKYNLKNASICNVLNRKRKYVGDWVRPDNQPKTYILIDPNGNSYEVIKISEFSREHGLSRVCVGDLIRKKIESHAGWTRLDSTPRGIKIKLISPLGEVVEAQNMSEFCRTNGLSQGHISSVILGKRNVHKGWTTFK